jgi:hypothetical protein
MGYYPFADIVNGTLATEPPDQPPNRLDAVEGMEHEDVEQLDEWPAVAPPGFSDPESLSEGDIRGLLVLLKGRGSRRGNQLIKYGVGDYPCSCLRSLTYFIGSTFRGP